MLDDGAVARCLLDEAMAGGDALDELVAVDGLVGREDVGDDLGERLVVDGSRLVLCPARRL